MIIIIVIILVIWSLHFELVLLLVLLKPVGT